MSLRPIAAARRAWSLLRQGTARIDELGAGVGALSNEIGRIDRARAEAEVQIAATRSRVDAIDGALAQLREREAATLALLVQSAARNMAHAGDHRLIPAFEVRNLAHSPDRPLRIGLFDNMANQAFNTARALRKLGHDVEVVIQENGFDSYPLARPQWEDCEAEITSPEQFRPDELAWKAPDFVRYVPYNHALHATYAGRPEAAQEVAELYRKSFGKPLALDAALILSQHMTQWDYIAAMNDYDVVMLTMSATMFGAFSPKPVVLSPLGGELYIRAFDQDAVGLLFRAAFRQAAHIFVCETDYFGYIDRLETYSPRSFMPLLVDTDVYCPGEEPELRAEWKAQVGGERFLLGVCRQDWEWKGPDKLIRAFARFHEMEQGRDWRLILSAWGNDIDKSRELVRQLGLDHVTLWVKMCSKPILRRRQRAADAVADQFVMEGYGISVLETLAAGTPVVMRAVPDEAMHHFRHGPPPLVGAGSDGEIVDALLRLSDSGERQRVGAQSRSWIEAEHGYRSLGPLYAEGFARARDFGRKT